MALAIWEFFFKYPPVVFEKGRIVFSSPLPLLLLVAAVALIGVAFWSYLRSSRGLELKQRIPMLVLRAALFILLLILLFRPTLQVAVAVEQENYLGILIDDSRSMLVADDGNVTRAQALTEQLNEAFFNSLRERFRIRVFRFSGDAERVDSEDALSFAGGQSRIGAALAQAQNELSGVPTAGLIVVSDGADQSEAELNASLLGLKTAGIPVYTVGVGREEFARDIEVRRVSSPRSVLRGTSTVVDVVIAQNGYAGRTIPLIVEDNGQVVNSQEVTMPSDGTPASVSVHFSADQAGWRRFTFRVPLQPDELVIQNNEREVLIDVRDGRQKILFFEGEPRWEVKFMRRAVAEDPELQLVLLQRTAENKFLRLDVDDGEELADGFPIAPEELFSYKAIVIGSVEASFFSRDQLRLLADFVSNRGGSILFLGGRRSFTEGGYAGTPIADLLPVYLEGNADPTYYRELKVALTRAGEAHAALRLDPDPERSLAKWDSLPELSTFNRLTRLKPGATALLTGSGPGVSDGQIVLASQRYGRGTVLAMPVQDTWLWQMHADVPLDNQSHEILWRQMLRWLVNDVPDQLALQASAEPAALGQTVQLKADLRDKSFTKINDAVVLASVETPTGEIIDVPLRWTSAADGEYTGSFVPTAEGLHRVSVNAERAQENVADTSLMIDVVEDQGEYFNAQMRAPLLRRMSEETGGAFYPLAEINRLSEEVKFSGSGITRVESYDLWDMPIVFFMIVGLVGAEWGIRRRRGLA